MRNKRESGEVVVEASIIVSLVLLFIMVMLYIGMIFYQKTMITVVANQTAANIAQVYGNNVKDPFTGYVDVDKVYQSITYGNMKTDAYMEVIERKASALATYRLKSSQVLNTGDPVVDVQIVKKPNELLKSQIVVTIRDSYDVPLVRLFGASGVLDFTAMGRADCVDILEYLNGVEAVGDVEHSNVNHLPDMDNCKVTFVSNRDEPYVVGVAIVFRGGSILSSSSYTHAAMPPEPFWNDYQFSGWVTESNVPFTASMVVEDDMIVYGTWKCKVTLDADGGQVRGLSSITLDVDAGSRTLLPNASRDGCTFKGWYTERGGSGTRYISNDTQIHQDVMLYAHWECTHEDTPTARGFEYRRTVGSVCTDNPYDLYVCQRCGAEKHIDVRRHNTQGICRSTPHFPAEIQSWTGTCGIHKGADYKGVFHACCTRCGELCTEEDMEPVVLSDGRVITFWYRCGGCATWRQNMHACG